MIHFAGRASTTRAVPVSSARMLCAWTFYAGGSNYDILAQSIGADGLPKWAANGISVCNQSAAQSLSSIAPDGSGGVFITWYDARSGLAQIYAQRVSSAGVALWTANGVLVSANPSGGINALNICSDGSGGCVVVWSPVVAGVYYLRAQRLSSVGAEQWTSGGVNVTGGISGTPILTDVIPDAGGCYVCLTAADAWVTRIASNGTTAAGAWPVNVSGATGSVLVNEMQIAKDGAGGVWAVWVDTRAASRELYAQRISSAGAIALTADGKKVMSGGLYASGFNMSYLRVIADGIGGVYAVLDGEGASFVSSDLRACLVQNDGAIPWGAPGVTVSTASGLQSQPRCVIGRDRSLWVMWYDSRTGAGDIYAQRLSDLGVAAFAANGIPVCTATGEAGFDIWGKSACQDGELGVVVVWVDLRSGIVGLYAQRILDSGAMAWTANGVVICNASGISSQAVGVAP